MEKGARIRDWDGGATATAKRGPGKGERKYRRILSLRKTVKYAGPGEPSPGIFSLCVPRDVVEALGLEAGAKFRFRRLGSVLAFVPVGGA